MLGFRRLAENVRDVDDAAVLAAQIRCRRLAEEERGAGIGIEQIVPLRIRAGADRCRRETAGVVDQHVEPAEVPDDARFQLIAMSRVGQIGLQQQAAVGTLRIQYLG